MSTHKNQRRAGRARRRGVVLATTLLTAGLVGCDSLLEVENPNNVVQEDLEDAGSVNAVVNGVRALTSQAVGDVAVSTAALSDELAHTGSQNWAAELDVGSITNPAGRSDALTNALAEAAWLAGQGIERVEAFKGELPVATDYADAYLYSGILYMTIADNMEDFAFSNRTEVSPPLGEGNMQQVYETAIDHLATAAANSSGDRNLAARALQARAEWAMALWPKLQSGSAPAEPLVNDAEANALASAILGEIGVTSDWVYGLDFSASTSSNPMGSWINSRQEFVVGPAYAVPDNTGKQVDFISLEDPIDGGADPAVENIVFSFVEDFLYADVRVVSARELHLILAEAALAEDDLATAELHINHVRALKGASAYDRTAAGAPSVLEMLMHERRANLFFMPTRRLWDHYRFDQADPNWAPGADAQRNGQVFVIGQSERISNCYILGTCGG